MGRPGAGSGGPRSGGGSRSSGGHRVGSSSRGGSRPGGGSSRPSRGSGGPGGGGPRHDRGPGFGGPRHDRGPGFGGPRHHGGPGMPPPRHHHHGGPGMPPPPRRYRRRSDPLTTIVSGIILLILVLVMFAAQKCERRDDREVSNPSGYSTQVKRHKLNSGNSYRDDCVKDEIGWIESTSTTGKKLKTFWQKTGVQPYIILKSYDASLTTDEQKEQWTMDYYDKNFESEDIFLYVYFAEEDTDNVMGYLSYVGGADTTTVMDDEAIRILQNNIDDYWETDLSMDDVFIKSFSDTANEIMR